MEIPINIVYINVATWTISPSHATKFKIDLIVWKSNLQSKLDGKANSGLK